MSYSEVRERGGGQVEQAISLALEDIARGVSQHQAAENHGAPYSSTNKAWRALGASLLFKLRGGATGEMGLKLIRAKEVERRLKIARVEARQKARAGKKEAQTNSDWQVAADALTDLKSKGYELGSLKKEQLLALVRVLGAGKAQGNKPELAALLTERFGNITSRQFQQIQTTVQRGLALTLLPPPPVAPLPLTEPVQALAEPPAPAEQEQLSLAQRRSRR